MPSQPDDELILICLREEQGSVRNLLIGSTLCGKCHKCGAKLWLTPVSKKACIDNPKIKQICDNCLNVSEIDKIDVFPGQIDELKRAMSNPERN